MQTKVVSKDNTPEITIVEIEAAINYWRQQQPSSGDSMVLCAQASSLAELYAHMILFKMSHISVSAAEFTDKAKGAFQDAQRTEKVIHAKAA